MGKFCQKEELVNQIRGDSGLLEKFKSDPKGTVKGLLPAELPEDTLSKIADGVKAALAGDKISGAADKLKGIFGK